MVRNGKTLRGEGNFNRLTIFEQARGNSSTGEQ